jgi:3-oxoacyl-[acyl-carrier-protein] synthase-1
MSQQRVMVSGLGVVSSLGIGAAPVTAALRAGTTGIRQMPAMAEAGLKCQLFAPVADWDEALIQPGRSRQTMSRSTQFAVAAAEQALAESGLDPSSCDRERFGVVVGSALSGIHDAVATQAAGDAPGGASRSGVTSLVRFISSSAAGNLSARFGLRGRSQALCTGCAGGADSIGHAFELVANGDLDVCLCGSAEEDIWRHVGLTFDNWGAMPRETNDDPAAAVKPFSTARRGFVVGSGSGMLLLESAAHAAARGARVQAEIIGYGSANDGFDLFQPSGEGLKIAGAAALAQARVLRPGLRITYLNGHGAASVIGDPLEVEAVRTVFADDRPWFSGTKPLSGHAMGGAGSLEAVFTLLMMRHGFIVPTANLADLAPECAGVEHVRSLIDTPIPAAATWNSGLGGSNACLVFAQP